MNTHRQIILASKSPRRADLLRMADIDFVVASKNTPETHPQGVPPHQIPQYLATQKAMAFLPEIDDHHLVIGADTIVICDGLIFEKPTDAADAQRMLLALSGKTHTVVTGVCILSKHKQIAFSETTEVTFNTITPEEAAYYVSRYQPFDKAGSYACQEWIGAVAIKKFNGDYFNVVGLPVNRVYAELKNF